MHFFNMPSQSAGPDRRGPVRDGGPIAQSDHQSIPFLSSQPIPGAHLAEREGPLSGDLLFKVVTF
jgi:hypothetical protein